MKRTFYIFCFTVLGLLLQFIVHALVEMGVISLLLKDFGRYGLGLSWSSWYLIHHVLTALLVLIGAWWGYASGVKYWNIIYVEKRFGWPPKRKRWKEKHLEQGNAQTAPPAPAGPGAAR